MTARLDYYATAGVGTPLPEDLEFNEHPIQVVIDLGLGAGKQVYYPSRIQHVSGGVVTDVWTARLPTPPAPTITAADLTLGDDAVDLTFLGTLYAFLQSVVEVEYRVTGSGSWLPLEVFTLLENVNSRSWAAALTASTYDFRMRYAVRKGTALTGTTSPWSQVLNVTVT